MTQLGLFGPSPYDRIRAACEWARGGGVRLERRVYQWGLTYEDGVQYIRRDRGPAKTCAIGALLAFERVSLKPSEFPMSAAIRILDVPYGWLHDVLHGWDNDQDSWVFTGGRIPRTDSQGFAFGSDLWKEFGVEGE